MLITRLIARWLLLLAIVSPSAGNAAGPLGTLIHEVTGVTPNDFAAEYAFRTYQEAKTNYQNKLLKLTEEKINLHIPQGEWAFNPSAKIKKLTTDARIPGTNLKVPVQVWDQRFRIKAQSLLVGTTGGGLNFIGGSASNEPFERFDEVFFDLTAYLTFGAEPRTTFVFFTNFSNLRAVANGIPIPGFSYGVRLSPRWGISLGFPHFSIWAEPFDWLKFQFDAEPIINIDAKLSVAPNAVFNFYWQFLAKQDIFMRAFRADRDQRMVFTDYSLNMGLLQKYAILFIDAKVGWSFLRSIAETKNYIGDRNNLLKIAQGWFGHLGLKASF